MGSLRQGNGGPAGTLGKTFLARDARRSQDLKGSRNPLSFNQLPPWWTYARRPDLAAQLLYISQKALSFLELLRAVIVEAGWRDAALTNRLS